MGAGLRSLFSGVEVAILTSPLSYGLYFAAYEPLKEFFEFALGQGYESVAYFAGSTVATAVSFLLDVPVEVVKTRLMTGLDKDATTCIRRILKSEGLCGLYTGFWSLVLRELPFNVIEMVVYEQMRRQWSERLKGGGELLGWETCCVAAVCDGSVGLITNPFDVIKSRLMEQAGSAQPKSLWATTSAVLIEDGPLGLFQGCSARMVWMSTGGVIFWWVLEEVQIWLRRFPAARVV